MADDAESEAFCQLLSSLHVPQALQQSLLELGIASIADFAYAYNSTADLSHFIAQLPDQLWQDLGVQDPEHCPATARLRRALDKCKATTQAADGIAPTAASPSAVPPQATAPNVWAEHAPPRLDQEAVNKLIAKFRTNYPSEHLDSDTRPSIRLLSLVHQWFKPQGTIRWVPWQLRMSEKTYQELIEARSARTLRTEAQLISSALFDETPEVSIATGAVNTAWLIRTQTVFSNAIAICGGAHLRILRAFDKKVLDLATQSLAPDSGLRAVHTQELLQADRKIWSELAALHAEGWSLDEALHEVTKVRSDLHALLQPRAKPIVLQSKGGKGVGKKGKDGKGKLNVIPTISKAPNDPRVASAIKDLATKHGNKTLCLRFNRQQCTNKQCKYAHLCAVKLPNGQACGQRHPAYAHKFRSEADASAPPGT